MSGALSEQWPTKRLRYLTFRSSSNNRRTRLANISVASFLPMEAIGEQGQLDLSAARPVEEVQSGYSQFFDGDVVIAKITPCFENGKGALIRGTLGGVGFGTTELYVLTPRPDLEGRFLYYITIEPSFRQLGEASMTGAAGQQRVPEDFVRDHRVRVPKLSQQRTIADYLDRETARLDTLVVAKKRSIALLKERRAALIATAVMGQIDVAQAAGEDHAPVARGDGMSAVAEQLAPIFPNGWGTTQLRYASTCLDGRRVPLNIEQRSRRQGEYPYWGANGVVDSIDEYLFDEPLVLIGEDGAPFFDSTRQVAFFVTGKIWVNNHIHVLRIGRNFDPRFVTYCLNATDYGPHIEGSTRDKLTQEKMGSIRLPSPPLTQQRAIADYLDRETARLDTLVVAKKRSIALLKERRAALITAAVTGQIDVAQAA